MRKTIWLVIEDNNKTEVTYYHFGKEPRFPAWYLEADHAYEIEMLWCLPLVKTFSTFYKCLIHHWHLKFI